MRIKEILEGTSPHPKGSKKYKAHMAAIHASAEPKGKMIEGDTFQLDEAQYYIWQIDGNSALVSAVGPDGQPAPKDQARRINIGQKVLDMSSGMPTLRDKIQMVAIDNQLTGQMVDIQGRVR